MRILIITQYFYPETFRVNTLCKELAERGHDVTVLTGYPQYPQGKIFDGYGFRVPYQKEWHKAKIERLKVIPRGRTPFGLLLNCWSFVHEGNKWAKSCTEKFDAIYVYGISPVTVGLPAVTYRQKFGTPVFFNVQDLWPENIEVVLGVHNKIILKTIHKIVNKIYHGSDKILCASNGFVEYIHARGIPQDKLVFWPQFSKMPKLQKVQKPDIYSENTLNIVFAGNIGNAQGLDLLVEAAEKLRNEAVKWYIVGDGRARARIKDQVEKNGLSEKIIFTGKVSEKEANRYIHFADCAYLSFQDNTLFDMTIPAKLQTYLACGVPVLAAAGGESAKIIREAKCGIAINRDAAVLADTVRKLLSLPKDELIQMRENAFACWKKHYDVTILVSQLEDLMKGAAYENITD